MKTWGELRTLNSSKLIDEMAKFGKSNRIAFKMSSTSSGGWVIISESEFGNYRELEKEIEVLKRKLLFIREAIDL